MQNKFDQNRHANGLPSIYGISGIGLPLIALGLDLSPILIIYLTSIIPSFSAVALLFVILLPIAGLITGVGALRQGKGQMRKVSTAIAIVAVALPLALVAFILIFYIGAVTGIISFM